MLKRKSENGKLNNGLSHCIRIPFQSHYVRLNLHSLFSALTTSSFRNPCGITFSYATRDLLLPMLTSLNQLSFAVKAQASLAFAHLHAALSNPRSQTSALTALRALETWLHSL